MPTSPGLSLWDFLLGLCPLDDGRLARLVQTILVNARPISDPTRVYLQKGDTIALSAAMPGLAGALLRSKAPATQAKEKEGIELSDGQRQILVRLKLFNLLIPELGPCLLAQGVVLPRKGLLAWLQVPRVLACCRQLTLNGRSLPCTLEAIEQADWPDWLRLKINSNPVAGQKSG